MKKKRNVYSVYIKTKYGKKWKNYGGEIAKNKRSALLKVKRTYVNSGMKVKIGRKLR